MTLTDAQNRALVKKAIAAAEARATDDAEYARILMATYYTSNPDMQDRQRRAVGRVRGGGGAVDPIQEIMQDPRYLQNLRKLAERTAKKLRIIGGTKVPATEFPDCVAIGTDTQFGCTGTLIAPNVVLSAGHCPPFDAVVFFGSDVEKKGTRIRVKEAIPHANYNDQTDKNDLMVLILDKKSAVKPRKIATSARIDAATEGRAVGFGNTDKAGDDGYGMKRQVDVPIVSAGCSGKVKGKTDSAAYGCHRLLEVVAGKPLSGKDSCTGDSGGPFYISDGKKGWLLAGATSRATDGVQNNCGDGGIYVRVDKYVKWIEKTAGVKLG